jgi:peroxiredoxin
MLELGQLESHAQEFEKRGVPVVVISIEGLEEAKATREQFPHLEVVSDADRKMIEAVSGLHPKSDPHGGDTAAPTTMLVDGSGTVRWTFRPDRVFTRLSPDRLLAAIDAELPAR